MTTKTDDLARRLLGRAIENLDDEERRVLREISERRPISKDAGAEADDSATKWDHLADQVAAVGGSWGFIFAFLAVLLAWMLFNTDILAKWDLAFDPFPFIFLNLMLSMIAALQAPIIMMSQNRQAAKDRIAARSDYEINLKAELEIMALHEKLDALRIQHLEIIASRQAELIDLMKKRLNMD